MLIPHVVARALLPLLVALVPPADARIGSQLKVFLLAGQSNMVGAGEVRAREDKNGGKGSLEHLVRDAATRERYAHLVDGDPDGAPDGAPDGECTWVRRNDVWIAFRGAREVHGELAPGYGAREDAIGPELGFGHVVGDAFEEQVLLVKVAWGGKSLAVDFRPPSAGGEVGPSYRALFAEVRQVLEGLGGLFPEYDGEGYELVGFGWHQGWNDRINQEFNDAYEKNMACFVRDAREELGVPDLPFVIAETGMSGPEEKHPRALSLMAAQAAVAQREEFRGTVAFVPTRALYRPKEESPTGQAYHWNNNAETYYRIGEDMGHAMLELVEARAGRRGQ